MSLDFIIDWEPYKTDFRGHDVTMQLRPLKRWASVLLSSIYEESAEIEKKKKKKEKFTINDINFQYRVQEVATKVFPDHVKDIVGITINKQPMSVQTLCDETAFSGLCMDIIGELSKRSQLLGDDEKNSDGPSGTQMKQEDNTQEP